MAHMAQHKYDMVTVPTKPVGPPRHHPWYKERLDLKFMKHGRNSGCLDGRKWTLLAGNMDDFRTGVPAQTTGNSMVTKGRVNPVPLVDSSRSLHSNPSARTPRKTVSIPPPSTLHSPGHSTLHSKIGPQRQAKLARLRHLEERLLRHPLSLYPHLQESIPAEVVEDVVGILDQESASKTAGATCVTDDDECGSVNQQEDQDNGGEDNKDQDDVPRQTAIYHWPLRQTEAEKREEQRAIANQKVISPSQEAKVHAVTRNLVQWGRELDGSEKTSDIDEATVKNLFASDYETRPMTAPIRVVDLTNVPLELRGDSPLFSAQHSHLSPYLPPGSGKRRCVTTPGHSTNTYNMDRPRYVKSRYGAWYLPTNLWRLQRADEPLHNPSNVASQSVVDLVRQDEILDDAVAQLHGARAYRDYYADHKPGSELPSFLQHVVGTASSRNLYSTSR